MPKSPEFSSNKQRKKPGGEAGNSREGLSRREMVLGLAAAISGYYAVAKKLNVGEDSSLTVASDWNPEVTPADDIDEMFDRSGKMEYFKGRLRDYIKRVRSAANFNKFQEGADVADSKQFILQDRPDCFYDMLDPQMQRGFETYLYKRSVWIYGGQGRLPNFSAVGLLEERVQKKAIEVSRLADAASGTVMRSGGRYFIQTNMHVIQNIDPRYKAEAKLPGPPDLAFYSVTRGMLLERGLNPDDAVDIDESLPEGYQLQGSIVASRPFDPDAYPGPDVRIPQGHKSWLGVAIKAAWSASSFPALADKELTRHSFMYIIERGESDTHKFPAAAKTSTGEETWTFASGVSGSGIASYYGGKIFFVGTNTASFLFKFQEPVEGESTKGFVERDASTIFFYSRDEIRKALRDHKRIFEFEVEPTEDVSDAFREAGKRRTKRN